MTRKGQRTHTFVVHPRALSMRWWLALAFAGIAALTALAVAQVFTARSEAAIRERARDLAAGSAVTAAPEISAAPTLADLRATTSELEASRGLALFVFDRGGLLLTPRRSRGVEVTRLPNFGELQASAAQGRRVVEGIEDGRIVTVALPLRGESATNAALLIAVAGRPDLEAALGIVQDEIVKAALLAVAIGAVTGLGVALLITMRLRRIANAAAEIEQGHFDRALRPRFQDELGVLAGTIDSMRERLRVSFERLGAERDRLNELLEQLHEGVVAVNRNLTVEFANPRAHALLGDELAPGRTVPDPWPDFSLQDAVTRLFEPGSEARTIRTQPDAARTFIVSLIPPTSAVQAGTIVVNDVTEAERRERAEREFVTNAAHELRTPLAAIASAVEALQHGAKGTPADRDRFLEVVERQTSRLSRLAHALLTLARAQTRSEPVHLEPVAVAPLIRQIAAPGTHQTISVDICCETVRVLAHPELLHQALDNLTRNALKHAAGRRLVLRVAHVDDDRVRIDVADEGPGMSAREAQRALDRFYRASTDQDGFGLGLSIAREVVAVMEGTLSIMSDEGRGTTVSIVLAAAEPARLCG